MEGHEDLVSRLIIRRPKVTIWVIGVINLLTKPPCGGFSASAHGTESRPWSEGFSLRLEPCFASPWVLVSGVSAPERQDLNFRASARWTFIAMHAAML